MDTVKKTHQEVGHFVAVANQWLADNPKQSKFSYALGRVLKRCAKVMEDYQDALGEINIEHCLTDKEGTVLTEQPSGAFKYDKDSLRKRNKAQRELIDTAVEIQSYHATGVLPELDAAYATAFEGFVIPESSEPE